MSETVQFVLLTWQALTPTIGTFLLSVIMPVTTVPWDLAGRARTAIMMMTESLTAGFIFLFTALFFYIVFQPQFFLHAIGVSL